MKTQIWIAISIYVLVAIVKKRLALDASLYTLLQILSLTIFGFTINCGQRTLGRFLECYRPSGI